MLGDDAALQVLHDLDLARRDHLAVAAGDLVELGPARPGEEDGEEGGDREQQQMGEAARDLQLGAGAAEHELGIGRARAGAVAAARRGAVTEAGVGGAPPRQVCARMLAGGERLQHLVPRSVGDHPAAVQHDQPVDQGQQRGAVRDQQQGLAGQDLARGAA